MPLKILKALCHTPSESSCKMADCQGKLPTLQATTQKIWLCLWMSLDTAKLQPFNMIHNDHINNMISYEHMNYEIISNLGILRFILKSC